jgi:hypothetical protein
LKKTGKLCKWSTFQHGTCICTRKDVYCKASSPFSYNSNIFYSFFRKAIFIFLSNTGSKIIADKLLNIWESGRKREDIHLNDFEDLIRKGIFNEKGKVNKIITVINHMVFASFEEHSNVFELFHELER